MERTGDIIIPQQSAGTFEKLQMDSSLPVAHRTEMS
ncbi:rCG44369 [Rattus norvegicus]|uniref:RCG44369 n=1 Tax=Rattus norvegicus TaxID=10116 RepID=A6I4J7_RAT|nr:rCG44369 [Rattus norvegicus]